jgi:hypothetical protein
MRIVTGSAHSAAFYPPPPSLCYALPVEKPETLKYVAPLGLTFD